MYGKHYLSSYLSLVSDALTTTYEMLALPNLKQDW